MEKKLSLLVDRVHQGLADFASLMDLLYFQSQFNIVVDAINEPLINDWIFHDQETISFSPTNNYIKKHYPFDFPFLSLSCYSDLFFYETIFFKTKTETIFFWNRDFLSETKFSETKFSEMETNFPRNRTEFFETDTETLENLAKVSKPKCHTLPVMHKNLAKPLVSIPDPIPALQRNHKLLT